MINAAPTADRRAVSLGRRDNQISRLRTEQFDLVIIGGGITGAGIALDAASRGLKVALVEKSDFASGTSSRSTKLIHGGLRYLAQLRFRLTREALAERTLLQRLAPHLVEPIPFLFPIYHKRLEVWRVNTGLWLYDFLAGLRRTKLHKKLSREDVLRRFPQLSPDGLRAGFVYYDARTDDCRLVVEVLKAAVENGATVANYVCSDRILTNHGKAFGVTVRDVLDGSTFDVRAHKVIVAAGVWLDQVLAGDQPVGHRRVRPAKGVHLIVPRGRLGGDTAVAFPTPDGRLMFVIPWQGATLIGTTDTDYNGPLEDPRASQEDIDYILRVVNATFPSAHLTEDDIVSVQAGLRPLVDGGADSTAKVSREDRVFENADGSIAIAGGKLTTYRRMGRKVVDLAVRRLREEGLLRRKPHSRTARLPLGGFPERAKRRLGRFIRRRRARLVANNRSYPAWLSPETANRLWRSYGANWQAVIDLATANPKLADPVVDGLDTLKAEIIFAARNEMACTICDVLARRTHVALLDRNQGRLAVATVAELLAQELGWTPNEVERQIALYFQQVEQFSISAVE